MHKMFVLLTLCSLLISACGTDNLPDDDDQVTASKVISAPAELVSLQEISITPPSINRMWEYKIEFIARENTFVKKGDVVLKFDGESLRNNMLTRRSDLDAAVKEAEQKKLANESDLEEFQLDLAEAKKNMDIAQRKVEITDVSRSDIERRKQQAELRIATELHKQAIQRIEQHRITMQINQQVQAAKISKAQSKVDELEQSLQKLRVTAPKDGMVVLIPNDDDEKPAIGDTVSMGRRLLALPALDMLAVKVELDESYTPQIVLGNSVRITLDAFPERPFSGSITELGKTYRNKSSTNQKMVFDAWITLDELDLSIMRPGMKATVAIGQDVS